jgi:hypothetical protein
VLGEEFPQKRIGPQHRAHPFLPSVHGGHQQEATERSLGAQERNKFVSLHTRRHVSITVHIDRRRT